METKELIEQIALKGAAAEANLKEAIELSEIEDYGMAVEEARQAVRELERAERLQEKLDG